jgi:D-glycero-D-manno-heptose 1,7-bisphosphate phosphatase
MMTDHSGAQRRAVFLDRDGVLNRAPVRDGRPFAPVSLDQFTLLPGVVEATRLLHEAGFLLIVATNQPDVARGLVPRDLVDEMHRRLSHSLPLDDIRVCFEEDGPSCSCYKPKPGMLLDAAAQWGIDLGRSYMVGDRWRDVDCAHNAGCFSLFIDYDYDEILRTQPDAICASLAEAAGIIVARQHLGL